MSGMTLPTATAIGPAIRPLICPDRLPDEGPRGYLLRLAEGNRADVMDVLGLVGPSEIGFIDDDGVAISLSLARRAMSDFCRFCPRCVRSRQCWHYGWELPFADACALCGAWLVDACSRCTRMLSWRRSRLMYCTCGNSLALEAVSDAPIAVRRLAESLASLNRGSAAELAPLRGLNLEQALEVASFVGHLVADHRASAHGALMRLRPLVETWSTTTAAAEILVHWPHAMSQVLDACREAVPVADRGSLLRSFPSAYATLYRNPQKPHLQVIRDAFEGYVLERWPGQIVKRHRRFDVLPETEPSWLRLSQAAQLTGYPISALRQMVKSGTVQAENWVTARGRQFLLLRRESVDALQEEHGGVVDLATAAMRLGLHDSRLAELLPWVCPNATAPVRQGARWIVPLRWVERWERFLQRQPRMGSDLAEGVTFADGLRYLFPDSRAIADLLLDVEGGKVRLAGRVPGLPGLSSLVFDKTELREWLQRHAARAQTLSLRSVAKQLEIKEEVAYFLARTGRLKTQTVRVGRRRHRQVIPQDLAAFLDTYVLATAVARVHRTSARAVQRFLASVGVTPVAGPGVDGCRQLLYRRREVDRALSAHGLTQPSTADCLKGPGK